MNPPTRALQRHGILPDNFAIADDEDGLFLRLARVPFARVKERMLRHAVARQNRRCDRFDGANGRACFGRLGWHKFFRRQINQLDPLPVFWVKIARVLLRRVAIPMFMNAQASHRFSALLVNRARRRMPRLRHFK